MRRGGLLSDLDQFRRTGNQPGAREVSATKRIDYGMTALRGTHEPRTPLPAPARVICANVGSVDAWLCTCSFMKNEYDVKTTPLICAGA